jgi:hypothetical protein
MGIFDAAAAERRFDTYRFRLQVRDRLYGGIPKDPQMVEAWLRTSAGISDEEERRQALLRTLRELNPDIAADADYDDVVAASKELAAETHCVGFKTDEASGHIYYEGRCLKACFKEVANIVWGSARQKFGATGKGAKNWVAERLFVYPSKLTLGRTKPDGVELFVGHIKSMDGTRSTLGYFEYVDRPVLTGYVLSMRGALTQEQWADLWFEAQQIGIGARRSQSSGQFDIEAWDLVRFADIPADARPTPTALPTDDDDATAVAADD